MREDPQGRDGRSQEAARQALSGVSDVPLWLDTPLAPVRRPQPEGHLDVDLAIVGGGLTGLWAAHLAAEQFPARSTLLLEAADLGWAASGRNAGFCSASLTHGLTNGLARWPQEMSILARMGRDNLDAIEDVVLSQGIDCDFRRTGSVTMAVGPWQVSELAQAHQRGAAVGDHTELLDAGQARALLDSPTYLGGLRDPRGTAVLNPAGLVWGLAEVAERAGAVLHERTRVTALTDEGDRVRLEVTGTGPDGARAVRASVRARRVLLATSAFPSPLHRVRPYVVPVWDHVLVTEPLRPDQRAAIGWSGEEGVGEAGRLHHYRLTVDGRIVWGGHDARYYFGGDLSAGRARNEATELMLAERFFATFPQLTGLRFTHAWGGAVDVCTRSTAFWQRAFDDKVCAVQGFSGQGVGASRFGAQVGLDLLERLDSTRTRLAMVRTRPAPFPPEPLRWAGISAARHGGSEAVARSGRGPVGTHPRPVRAGAPLRVALVVVRRARRVRAQRG